MATPITSIPIKIPAILSPGVVWGGAVTNGVGKIVISGVDIAKGAGVK